MRVLLVGSGGREHALAWKIAQSPLLEQLFVAPGNPGTAAHGRNVPVDATRIDLLVDIARRERIDLVVVGPEAPLAAGLTDACLEAGLTVFGPTAAAAQIESSKVFAKTLMREAAIPTAAAEWFDDGAAAAAFVRASGQPWVVKADGLAAGKGVVVADDVAATLAAIERLARTGAGQRLLLEQRLSGPEVSVIALCDGERLLPLAPAQDHKRLGTGDVGPNTGGMGAFAPSARLGPEQLEQAVSRLMLPAVRALAARGTPFRGALYAGLILTDDGPQVLEFNARFGDPETQALVPLIEGDLLAALLACAQGRLDQGMLGRRPGAAVCVVLAAPGYPDRPQLGAPISGVESVEVPGVLLFHAGVEWRAGQLASAGGRVLGVTGTGRNLAAARERAYTAIEDLSFEGMQFRLDIGKT